MIKKMYLKGTPYKDRYHQTLQTFCFSRPVIYVVCFKIHTYKTEKTIPFFIQICKNNTYLPSIHILDGSNFIYIIAY